MAARMTATQRADRDFWLGAAEDVDGPEIQGGLCRRIGHAGDGLDAYNRRTQQVETFRPEGPAQFGYWWKCHASYPVAPSEGRVLAACFLAAMCEAGDA